MEQRRKDWIRDVLCEEISEFSDKTILLLTKSHRLSPWICIIFRRAFKCINLFDLHEWLLQGYQLVNNGPRARPCLLIPSHTFFINTTLFSASCSAVLTYPQRKGSIKAVAWQILSWLDERAEQSPSACLLSLNFLRQTKLILFRNTRSLILHSTAFLSEMKKTAMEC